MAINYKGRNIVVGTTIELPENLYGELDKQAKLLEMTPSSIVEGLVRHFLERNTKKVQLPNEERRQFPRWAVNMPAILYFKTSDGRYGCYKYGDLKDLARGGILVECEAASPAEGMFETGSEFEIIFQLGEGEPPMRIFCQVCRVDTINKKTRVGASFSQADPAASEALEIFLRSS